MKEMYMAPVKKHVIMLYGLGYISPRNQKKERVPVAQWLEHCVSITKVVGSIPREHMN